MKDGFIKAAAAVPQVTVADPQANLAEIIKGYDACIAQGAKVIVFPELCISAYTCGDLFLQESLLRRSKEALFAYAAHTAGTDAVSFVGLPLPVGSKLYNVAAAVSDGNILGIVPKTHIPNYSEFYEKRYFCRGPQEITDLKLREGVTVPFGTDQLFVCDSMPLLRIACELCEDLWAPAPPSNRHAMAGATLIVNLSASDEVTGKDLYRRSLVENQSARLVCGYLYTSAGDGESTQDLVYSGHSLIAENGVILAETKRFEAQTILTEIDLQKLTAERRRISSFEEEVTGYRRTSFDLAATKTALTRRIDPAPFVPGGTADREKRCDEILQIQAGGLKKRLIHTRCTHAVVGISGGLDSTLALLVTARAFDLAGIDRSGITAVTMPGFGTTDRTYQNAVQLIHTIGASFYEVPIADAVRIHFRDIGHAEGVHDVTYENSQARERTQILMDLANQTGGLVIGTGDLSELALGWATYNGDHMSMYAVNCSVPKTLVRHLVRYEADTCGDEDLRNVLLDVLDTPVSPELLPPENGQISQKTEDLVGPYELHDFFLYHLMRFGCEPKKIFRLAQNAFCGVYDRDTILKWLKTFYRRFFSQQFKRSCLPDGPKVGSVAISPRGDWRMPSDAAVRIWMEELEDIDRKP